MIDASRNVYTFEVDRKATKGQIKSAIEDAFDVDVIKMSTSIRKPKTKRTGKKRILSSGEYRKIARAWVKPGQKIDLFEFKEK